MMANRFVFFSAIGCTLLRVEQIFCSSVGKQTDRGEEWSVGLQKRPIDMWATNTAALDGRRREARSIHDTVTGKAQGAVLCT